MYDSVAIPSSPVQKFINRIANSDLGVVLNGPTGQVKKINYSTVQYVETGAVVSNEDYFKQLQALPESVWTSVDATDPSEPSNANGVENLVE